MTADRKWITMHPAVALAAALAGGTIISLVRAHGNAPAGPGGAPAAANELSQAFKTAARNVAPSVVSIRAIDRDRHAAAEPAGPQEDPGELFRRFFDGFGPGAPRHEFRRQQRAMPSVPGEAQGTGFIVRANGYIVTNNHVVDGAEELRVRLDDGREYVAQVAGTDAESDLAVLKIEAESLVPAELGDDERIEVGEWVIAVGNPFGLEHSVTAGIVSAKGRSGIGLATFENYIQTDAAINPGNSGGPLVDLNGRVIGVNTAISTSSGGFMGVGFAIPAGTARHVVDGIIETGHVTRGWLGAHIQPLSDDLARSFGLERPEGALVADVVAGGPADGAGLEPGDVVTQVGGQTVSTPADLLRAVAAAAPGSALRLTAVRDGAERTVEVTLGERPATPLLAGGASPEMPRPDLGVTVLHNNSGTGVGRGALVAGVEPGGPAHRAGLRDGDLILKVAGRDVTGPESFWSAMAEAGADGARLLVRRGDHTVFLFLKKGDA
jgi:serine protease Do